MGELGESRTREKRGEMGLITAVISSILIVTLLCVRGVRVGNETETVYYQAVSRAAEI
jgi:hypothetical protein